MGAIKLLIVDDEKLFAEFLADFFNSLPDYEVLDVLHNGIRVVDIVKSKKPDIILLDLSMPELNGFETIQSLRKASAKVKIVILSSIIDTKNLKNLAFYGVEGVITKNTNKEEIEKGIRKVFFEGYFYSKELMHYFTEDVIRKESKKFLNLDLSGREIEILSLIIKQKTSTEISKMLNISIRTVETHRRNMMKKLNVKNTAGLIQAAGELNLVKVNDDYLKLLKTRETYED